MRTKTLKNFALSISILFSSLAAQSQCTATLSGGGALCADGSIGLTIDFEGGGPWTVIYARNGVNDGSPIMTSDNPFILNVNQTGTYTLEAASSDNCGTGIVSGSAVVNDNGPLDGGLSISPGCYEETSNLQAVWGGGTEPMEFLWNDGFTGASQDVEPYVTYTVTITDAAGCTTSGSAEGYEAIVECGLTQSAELVCAGNPITLFADCNSQVPILADGYMWSTGENGSMGIEISQPGDYSVTISNLAGCDTVLTINIPVPADCGEIQGKVTKDVNFDCLNDGDDIDLTNWMVRATGPEEFVALTDENGNYTLNILPGTYDVEVISPNPEYWNFCQNNVSTTIDDVTDVEVVDFFGQAIVDCPTLEVDIATWAFRRCFETTSTVQYTNMGTSVAEDAFIEITVDPELEILSAGVPFTGPVDNVYTFEIGDVEIGQAGSFDCTVYTSCDAVLDQTLCYEAHIFPDTICNTPQPNWSGASLEVSSICDGENLEFKIANVGAGDMNEGVQYIVIQDGVMMLEVTDGPTLTAGDDLTFSVPANGATYVLQVPQVEGHPGFSAPLLTIEGCGVNGLGEFSTGFVLQYPQDDTDYFRSIFCAVVQGAFDPNDKKGFPIGYGEQHFIEPGQELDYLIRFQNTGTDTAFNVRIEDVISGKLDLATFRPGASSHFYEIEFRGDTAVFLFPNIMLPDSNVNEPLSHGFVKFKIQQKEGNEIGDVIENTADIYFDFNEAVITNTTVHRLSEEFFTSPVFEPQTADLQVLISPNPASGETTFRLMGDLPKGEITLSIFDPTGKPIGMETFLSPSGKIDVSHLPGGLYFFQMKTENGMVGNGKLMVGD